jgi:ribose-phosphate pyrophosphokinase
LTPFWFIHVAKHSASSLPAMKIIAGNSNRPLAEAVAAYLNITLSKASIRRFADMEVFVEIDENMRGEDVFVFQSTSYPANDNLMELLVIIDAVRRASARRITAVIPYFGYARQDRKPGPRTPSPPNWWPTSSPKREQTGS